MAEPAQAVIWDVDGTLVDTAEMHYQAWVRLCRERGRAFTRDEFARTFGRRNAEILHEIFSSPLSESDIITIGDRKETFYRDAARAGVALLPGVWTLMNGLHAHGVIQAIGSSAPRANVDLILDLTGIARFIQAVVSAEDTRRGKPDPEVFLTAARRVGTDPRRCVVFEDAVAGVRAAKAAGMRCVAVGFVGHNPAGALLDAGADHVVHSLEELNPRSVLDLISSNMIG
jgi:beta-phosphoglucomutase